MAGKIVTVGPYRIPPGDFRVAVFQMLGAGRVIG